MSEHNMSTLFDSHIVSSTSFSLSSLSVLSLSSMTSISTDLLIDSIGLFDHIVDECRKNTNAESSALLKKCTSLLADIFASMSIEIIGMILRLSLFLL